MRKISKSIQSIFLVTGVIWAIFSFCAFTQEGGGPLPPPVEIEFTTENTPRVGEEVTLRLKVTPLEDMHADISCLLPEGIRPIREKGIIVRPCMDREWHRREQQTRYMEAVELWVGPLEGGITKEFVFRVVIPDKERYELIARVEALAKWGVKEEVLVIDIE